MIPAQEGAIVFAQPAATITTNGSHSISFDKGDFDYASIYLICGTHSTAASVDIGTISFVEHASITTPTSMTAIVAGTGGTVTSSSVGFVIPGSEVTGPGCVMQFNIDLRKRLKKIGMIVTQTNAGMNFATLGILTRSKESADSAAEKSALTLASNTNATSCALIQNF